MSHSSAGGVTLPDGPFMIGAGVCKNPTATQDWLKIAPVVSGSYTLDQRDGNVGEVMWPGLIDLVQSFGYGFNSYGMPNMGCGAASIPLARVKSEQPLIVSFAGFSVDEYVQGVKILATLESVSAIELNFGCPNTQGEHSTIISFDPETIKTIVHRVMQLGYDVPIWIKLSPYSNPQDLERVAKVLNGFVGKGTFQIAVVTCNTFPNAFAGEGKISPNNGLSGLSGPVMKPIALGQVKQFRQHLSPLIDVIGVGGVWASDDVVDFLDAGAAAVQVLSLIHI